MNSWKSSTHLIITWYPFNKLLHFDLFGKIFNHSKFIPFSFHCSDHSNPKTHFSRPFNISTFSRLKTVFFLRDKNRSHRNKPQLSSPYNDFPNLYIPPNFLMVYLWGGSITHFKINTCIKIFSPSSPVPLEHSP